MSVILLDGNKVQEEKPHKEEKPQSLCENLEDFFCHKGSRRNMLATERA